MDAEGEDEVPSINNSSKYIAAIQIIRPRSASKTGFHISNSSLNQRVKVAELVLKPVKSKAVSPLNQKPKTSSARSLSSVQPAILSINKIDNGDTVKELHGIELEPLKEARERRKTLKSPLIQNKQQHPVHSPVNQHKSKMDEKARQEAREFMKKQREKRKMEVKQEVDKSFVIKERLRELHESTKNAVMKKQQLKSKSPAKLSPPKDTNSNYYSMENFKMKEIKTLRLKPVSSSKFVEGNLQEPREVSNKSPVKPRNSISPIKKPTTPINKPQLSAVPSEIHQIREIFRPPSAKENRKPNAEDLKLKVPDIKLNITTNNTLNKTDLLSSTKTVPYFLQNVHQGYPHNFIWAVRKKLKDFVQQQQQRPPNTFETPQFRKPRKITKGRKIAHDLILEIDDDDSETNAKSHELQSEANTISEISSIQTDMAKSKSQSQEKAENNGDDDTTISESIFQSLADDAPFVGKKRESINSEFDRASFNKKVQENIDEEKISPNTSDKRNKFLSSTRANEDENIEAPKDKVVDEKEEEFRKMLLAFNKSLSHVVEVNHLLSNALVSKSSSIASSNKSDGGSAFVKTISSASAVTSKQEYSSSFEKNIDTNNEDDQRDTNSSIQTLIENSDETLKHETNTIEDPPIVYQQEQAQELTSSTTKVTTEKNSGKDDFKELHHHDNTLNESRLINLFNLAADAEVSFNTSSTTLMESNGTLSASHTAFVFNKSSSEIKSWEKSLIERTRGQIAWLELQKQHLRHGQMDKVSTIKRQQRAILMRLEKERAQLRENSEKALVKAEDLIDQAVEKLEMSLDGNGSDARDDIERVLMQREKKIEMRRQKIDHLMKWQQRLDEEERKLKKMEKELLTSNTFKASRKKSTDLLNTSLEQVKSIDKSLKVLESVEISHDEETVDVKGEKMNKLWLRLTGIDEEKFIGGETYHMTKNDLGNFYEEAKERVLESDLKMLLETSAKIIPDKSSEDGQSEVDTMNSIANIETEEEYPGSYIQPESEVITTSTENDDELQQFMANQMKVFVSSPIAAISTQKQAAVNDQTFQVQDGKLQGEFAASPPSHAETMMVNKHDESTSTIGEEDMDLQHEEEEKSSPICTEQIESIDLSAVDKDGFIIPEEINSRSLQVTDMDEDISETIDDNQPLIEDISFPNLSLNESVPNFAEDDRGHDLSTITECTEYEQMSSGPISSEIAAASHSSTPSSERVNSEIEQRLISINDSLEQVDEAFKKVPVQTTPSSEPTYSTDKDFIDFKDEKNLLILSPPSISSESVTSQITTSTPKVVLMPDVISDAETKRERSDDNAQ